METTTPLFVYLLFVSVLLKYAPFLGVLFISVLFLEEFFRAFIERYEEVHAAVLLGIGLDIF